MGEKVSSIQRVVSEEEEEGDGRGIRGTVWKDFANRGEKVGLNITEGDIV